MGSSTESRVGQKIELGKIEVGGDLPAVCVVFRPLGAKSLRFAQA